MSSLPQIRLARAGDERGIHEAHMRSIREVCSQAHNEDEIRRWGTRPMKTSEIGGSHVRGYPMALKLTD